MTAARKYDDDDDGLLESAMAEYAAKNFDDVAERLRIAEDGLRIAVRERDELLRQLAELRRERDANEAVIKRLRMSESTATRDAAQSRALLEDERRISAGLRAEVVARWVGGR